MRAVGQRKFWQIPDIFGGKLVVWWQDKRWPGWRGSEWAGPLACARTTRHDLTHISGSAAGPTATIESDFRTVRRPQLLQCFSDVTEPPYLVLSLVVPPKTSRSSLLCNSILASQNSWFKNFFYCIFNYCLFIYYRKVAFNHRKFHSPKFPSFRNYPNFANGQPSWVPVVPWTLLYLKNQRVLKMSFKWLRHCGTFDKITEFVDKINIFLTGQLLMNYRSLSLSSVVVVPSYIFHKSLCHYLLLYRF